MRWPEFAELVGGLMTRRWSALRLSIYPPKGAEESDPGEE